MGQKLRHRLLYKCLPEVLGGLLYAYPPHCPGADEVSWKSWQLVNAIHGEGDDGHILCEWHAH